MNEPLTEHEAQQAEAYEIMSIFGDGAALSTITTPAESRQVENMSRAAIAYYTETRDYESMIAAWRLYVLSRRHTTELLLQDGDNTHVTDLGFTPMQWSRRTREAEIPMDAVNSYFDDIIAKGWNPSMAGLWRSAGLGGGDNNTDGFAQDISLLVRVARRLFVPENAERLQGRARMVIANILDTFTEME